MHIQSSEPMQCFHNNHWCRKLGVAVSNLAIGFLLGNLGFKLNGLQIWHPVWQAINGFRKRAIVDVYIVCVSESNSHWRFKEVCKCHLDLWLQWFKVCSQVWSMLLPFIDYLVDMLPNVDNQDLWWPSLVVEEYKGSIVPWSIIHCPGIGSNISQL